MGLNVYLCYYPSLQLRENEIEYQRRDEELWSKYFEKNVEYAESEEVRSNLYYAGLIQAATELGLKATGCDTPGHGHEEILLDSRLYPNHLYKIGYFRSSAFGGFNEIMKSAVKKDLYWIFEPDDDGTGDCIFPVDWKRAHYRAKTFLAELLEVLEPGTTDIHAESDAYLIDIGFERSAISHGSDDWYVQTTEVVIETIEYVLESGEPQHYFLKWL